MSMFSCNINTISAFICGFFGLLGLSSAQQIGEVPSIHFNLLPFHAGTDQDLYVGAQDPDGTISEILIRLSEKAEGDSTYSEVWEHTGSVYHLIFQNNMRFPSIVANRGVSCMHLATFASHIIATGSKPL